MDSVPPLLPGEPPGRDGPPWERHGRSFDSLVDTVREVLLRPTLLFRSMRRAGGLREPIVFYLITASTGMVGASIFRLAFSRTDEPYGCLLVVLPAALLAVPLFAFVSLFVTSGILHLMLLLLDGARQPFETTVRVVAYGGGSTLLLGVIPFCGGLIGAVWQIVAEIVGLSEAHEISLGKAALAVLLPAVLCCAMLAAFLAFVGLAAATAVLGIAATGGR